jgi:hypothetical protein
MPQKKTIARARRAAREGKAPSTQAGEFVREEIEHIREGRHGARSTQQAIAIALSKARKAGVKVPAPGRGASGQARGPATRDRGAAGRSGARRASPRRSRATRRALRREGRSAASSRALARQARARARRRKGRSRGRA